MNRNKTFVILSLVLSVAGAEETPAVAAELYEDVLAYSLTKVELAGQGIETDALSLLKDQLEGKFAAHEFHKAESQETLSNIAWLKLPHKANPEFGYYKVADGQLVRTDVKVPYIVQSHTSHAIEDNAFLASLASKIMMHEAEDASSSSTSTATSNLNSTGSLDSSIAYTDSYSSTVSTGAHKVALNALNGLLSPELSNVMPQGVIEPGVVTKSSGLGVGGGTDSVISDGARIDAKAMESVGAKMAVNAARKGILEPKVSSQVGLLETSRPQATMLRMGATPDFVRKVYAQALGGALVSSAAKSVPTSSSSLVFRAEGAANVVSVIEQRSDNLRLDVKANQLSGQDLVPGLAATAGVASTASDGVSLASRMSQSEVTDSVGSNQNTLASEPANAMVKDADNIAVADTNVAVPSVLAASYQTNISDQSSLVAAQNPTDNSIQESLDKASQASLASNVQKSVENKSYPLKSPGAKQTSDAVGINQLSSRVKPKVVISLEADSNASQALDTQSSHDLALNSAQVSALNSDQVSAADMADMSQDAIYSDNATQYLALNSNVSPALDSSLGPDSNLSSDASSSTSLDSISALATTGMPADKVKFLVENKETAGSNVKTGTGSSMGTGSVGSGNARGAGAGAGAVQPFLSSASLLNQSNLIQANHGQATLKDETAAVAIAANGAVNGAAKEAVNGVAVSSADGSVDVKSKAGAKGAAKDEDEYGEGTAYSDLSNKNRAAFNVALKEYQASPQSLGERFQQDPADSKPTSQRGNIREKDPELANSKGVSNEIYYNSSLVQNSQANLTHADDGLDLKNNRAPWPVALTKDLSRLNAQGSKQTNDANSSLKAKRPSALVSDRRGNNPAQATSRVGAGAGTNTAMSADAGYGLGAASGVGNDAVYGAGAVTHGKTRTDNANSNSFNAQSATVNVSAKANGANRAKSVMAQAQGDAPVQIQAKTTSNFVSQFNVQDDATNLGMPKVAQDFARNSNQSAGSYEVELTDAQRQRMLNESKVAQAVIASQTAQEQNQSNLSEVDLVEDPVNWETYHNQSAEPNVLTVTSLPSQSAVNSLDEMQQRIITSYSSTSAIERIQDDLGMADKQRDTEDWQNSLLLPAKSRKSGQLVIDSAGGGTLNEFQSAQSNVTHESSANATDKSEKDTDAKNARKKFRYRDSKLQITSPEMLEAQVKANERKQAAAQAKLQAQADKLAAQNNLEALVELGDRSYYGSDNSISNYVDALSLYQRAAQSGSAEAQYKLSMMYTLGIGIAYDAKLAFDWCLSSAKQGYAEAQFKLGSFYYLGLGTKVDYDQAIYWYEAAAKQGHAIAKYNLAVIFERGLGVPQDYARAIKLYKESIDGGFKVAMYNLGEMYYWGYGVKQDYKQAYEYYHVAAMHGCVVAQYSIGYLYEKGLGIKQSDARAFFWYHKAATQNHALSQLKLGLMYLHGDMVPVDHRKAESWLELAAAQGNANAQYQMGMMAQHGLGSTRKYGQADYAKARGWYELAAVQGHALSELRMGEFYYWGMEMPQDLQCAFKYFMSAARHGETEAQLYVAMMYASGQGVEQNYAKALQWYSLAAEKNDRSAQYALGLIYALGYGTDVDDVKARDWFGKSALQGDAAAQYQLGLMWLRGRGGKASFSQALNWFTLSSEQNYPRAHFQLGLCYLRGIGVNKDFGQARYWFEKAALQGYADAFYQLGLIYEHGLGVNVNPVYAKVCLQEACMRGSANSCKKLREYITAQ